MKRRIGKLLMLLGALLVATAAVLLIFNQYEDRKAGEDSAAIMESIHQLLAAEAQAEETDGPEQPEATPEPLSAEELREQGYLGFLSLPTLDRELPIFDDWSEPRLKKAPCRQSGSLEDGPLVIAGHNYRRHFGPLDRLRTGDGLHFTDLDGQVYDFTVGTVEVIGAYDVARVTDDQWDLVLYTCDYSGQNRIMAGCVLDSTETE